LWWPKETRNDNNEVGHPLIEFTQQTIDSEDNGVLFGVRLVQTARVIGNVGRRVEIEPFIEPVGGHFTPVGSES
jgi:hypothetical protein